MDEQPDADSWRNHPHDATIVAPRPHLDISTFCSKRPPGGRVAIFSRARVILLFELPPCILVPYSITLSIITMHNSIPHSKASH